MSYTFSNSAPESNVRVTVFTGGNLADDLILAFLTRRRVNTPDPTVQIFDSQGNAYTKLAEGFTPDQNNSSWTEVWGALVKNTSTADNSVSANYTSPTDSFLRAVAYNAFGEGRLLDSFMVQSPAHPGQLYNINASENGELIAVGCNFQGGGIDWASPFQTLRLTNGGSIQQFDSESTAGANSVEVTNTAFVNVGLLAVALFPAVIQESSHSADAYVETDSSNQYSIDANIELVAARFAIRRDVRV